MQGKLNIVTLGLVGYCTVIASLVALFVLAPMMQFGGGPFGMGSPPTIPDDVFEDLKSEIYELESVSTFKQTFPDFREKLQQSYGVEYSIQARNANTGNVLSLMINYHPMGPPGTTDKFQSNEHIECIPGQGIVGTEQMMMQNMFRVGSNGDLFIHETIKSTDCLNDDWKPVVITGN